MATEQSVPALAVDDIVEAILLRFPPDDPAALVRAALVCKGWRRVVSDLGFRRRFRHVHGTAPMLGFLRQRGPIFEFQSTTSFRQRFPLAVDRSGTFYRYRAVDARHGRVLINRYSLDIPWQEVFVIWDPISGDQRTLPRPPQLLLSSYRRWSAAFFCAADGCDHLDCATGGGPFRVVFVVTPCQPPLHTSVYVYSSEIGVWNKVNTFGHPKPIGSGRSAMVGNALYFWFESHRGILKHDLDTQMSCDVQTPASIKCERVMLMATEDGRLGIAMIKQSKLSLWSRGASLDSGKAANAGWAQNRVIELNTSLPASALLYAPQLVGSADAIGANIIVQTVDGLFTIDLKSSHVKEIGKGLKLHSYGVVPFVSFCTPALGAASSGVGSNGSASTASQTKDVRVRASQ